MSALNVTAAGVGVLAGLLGLGIGSFGFSPAHGSWVWVVAVVSVVLVVESSVALVGPRLAFYIQAVLAALLVATEWGASDGVSPALLLVVLAGAATVALGILAARHEQRIPEQSHPMNLPVFG